MADGSFTTNAMPRIRQRCTQQRAAARPRPFRGDYLEQQVWSDIETFLRNPEPVLQQLQARLESDAKGSEGMQKQITRLTVLLDEKATERTRIVGLYRAVGSAKPNSTRKMDDIGAEEKRSKRSFRNSGAG